MRGTDFRTLIDADPHSYPELFGVADNNGYGLKVYAFLKLADVPFVHEHIFDASAHRADNGLTSSRMARRSAIARPSSPISFASIA